MSGPLPFWSDDFDMDLLKVFPETRSILGDLADVEMVTIGYPDGRSGRLNHPATWNGDRAMLAYFGFRRVRKPSQMIAPSAVEIRCTAWEAFRDAWPHAYLMSVEGVPVWNTFELVGSFQIILAGVRKWPQADPAKEKQARKRVLRSYRAAVEMFRVLVNRERARAA